MIPARRLTKSGTVGCRSRRQESLIGLLYEEADQEWLAELESESNRLEFVNSAGPDDRRLTDAEAAEVLDAVSQLRLGRPSGKPSKYPLECRRDAAAMVLDGDQLPIAEMARSFGINPGTLGNSVTPGARRGR